MCEVGCGQRGRGSPKWIRLIRREVTGSVRMMLRRTVMMVRASMADCSLVLV